MILVKILVKEPWDAQKLVEMLLKENLVHDVSVIDVSISEMKGDKIVITKGKKLSGRTTTALFTSIEEFLENYYKSNTPTIYGVPIVVSDVNLLV